ncbi:MAG: DUF1292 domain-containing protein [Lachnospiraceae bacterium]|nr:DUF1292 domain-containing protein [Lachnospiraceae bacterium]
MEKVTFTLDNQEGSVEFYVLEQTKLGGFVYLLVTESAEDEDGECLILKGTGVDSSFEEIYEVVEDDAELLAVSKVFEELLEDVDIEI